MSESVLDRLLERDVIPDPLLRFAIRRLVARRARYESRGGEAAAERRQQRLIDQLANGPVAVATDAANDQHYELPPDFFQQVLGPRLKYSSALWPAGVRDLAGAERAMLELTCRRALLEDGQDILELGCGWGSLTLWMAEHYPNARITGVSNSAPQRRFIEARAAERGLENLTILTADMNTFEPPGWLHGPPAGDAARFDRVVSVEMLEHMRNYAVLFGRIRSWLRDDGLAFFHVFCHRQTAYLFEDRDGTDWMARYFFTGGTMPSFDLFSAFDRDLEIERSWRVPGTHYQRTANAWLANLDARRDEVWPTLERTYGSEAALRWWSYWRIFFLACAELFGSRNGEEWLVGHYRLRPSEARGTVPQVIDPAPFSSEATSTSQETPPMSEPTEESSLTPRHVRHETTGDAAGRFSIESDDDRTGSVRYRRSGDRLDLEDLEITEAADEGVLEMLAAGIVEHAQSESLTVGTLPDGLKMIFDREPEFRKVCNVSDEEADRDAALADTFPASDPVQPQSD